MTLKVQRSLDNDVVVYTLAGRIKEEQLECLQDILTTNAEATKVVFDLTEIRLIDQIAVKFLASCEEDGVRLRNCPPYIREWISQERGNLLIDGSSR
ncbi:MAG: hypothetical protein JWO13_1323 [Acidobacteriales bacterium]|nr:hypothetical protein [Terriglobales bacterium]